MRESMDELEAHISAWRESPMQSKLRRLERAAHCHLESFELEDSRRHYYDPITPELFLHSIDCLRAQSECRPFPQPPETVLAIARARDRGTALSEVFSATFDIFPYDVEALV
jgi:hypothetical protein